MSLVGIFLGPGTGGAASTDPGEDKVLDGVEYVINGVAKTGTLGAIPPAGTADGLLSLPIERLARLIQACIAWASMGGGLADVWVMAAPEDATRPLAVIADSEQWLARSDSAVGSGTSVTDQGSLLLIIERDVTAGQDHNEAAIEFRNLLGSLIEEMLTKSGTGSAGEELLWISGIRMLEPPMRAHPRIREEEGDFYQVTLEITYGIAQ